jgi:hypothetical protein
MKTADSLEVIITEENEKIAHVFYFNLNKNKFFDINVKPTELEYKKVEWLYASNNKYPDDAIDEMKSKRSANHRLANEQFIS